MNIIDVKDLIKKGEVKNEYDWKYLSSCLLDEEAIYEFQNKLDWNIIK